MGMVGRRRFDRILLLLQCCDSYTNILGDTARYLLLTATEELQLGFLKISKDGSSATYQSLYYSS
jgi:hypothetical protein